MTPKLFKAAEVCDMAQVQPYVLRSWEKEFPGIGVQKSSDGPRVYRQSDVDQVLRIKQLVFGEGLTLAGARRRLEEAGLGGGAAVEEIEPQPEVDVPSSRLPSDARSRIAQVKQGLESILALLDGGDRGRGGDEYQLRPPAEAEAVGVGARAAAPGGRRGKRASA